MAVTSIRSPEKGRLKGTVAPYDSCYFMVKKIHPIAVRLGIPKGLVTFRVFRRFAATEMQKFRTIKDLQSNLRHVSPVTTTRSYVQPIGESTRKACG